MPFNNRSKARQSNNSGGSRRPGSSRGGNGAKKLRGGQEYNMLSFGIAYLDDNGKNFKGRVLLKNETSKVGIVDEQGNEFTQEEAVVLVAQALLTGRGISMYFFENDDGSMSGNARIDINGLSVDLEPEPTTKRKSASAGKRKVAPAVREYPEITNEDEDDEEVGTFEDEDEDDLPY
jgi:hypothetical protein